ncbi:hypothetical protein [Piscibacillus sp. B03]
MWRSSRAIIKIPLNWNIYPIWVVGWPFNYQFQPNFESIGGHHLIQKQ